MPAGQLLHLVVCSAVAPGVGAGQIAGPFASSACPSGEDQYVVEAYVPLTTSAGFIDGLSVPFSGTEASAFFAYGFGLVLFFYALGCSLSVVVKPFWRNRL